jgi:hypothetical protein
MTQQPSDYPVATSSDQPDRVRTFIAQPGETMPDDAYEADVIEQHLPPSGDDESEALDIEEERQAREDGDRPV